MIEIPSLYEQQLNERLGPINTDTLQEESNIDESVSTGNGDGGGGEGGDGDGGGDGSDSSGSDEDLVVGGDTVNGSSPGTADGQVSAGGQNSSNGSGDIVGDGESTKDNSEHQYTAGAARLFSPTYAGAVALLAVCFICL